MKLAEALILRADCQKRMEQLKQRLLRSAKVQEGDNPAEEPKALLAELEKVSEQLKGLIQHINRTNSATEFGSGMALANALAVRDILKLKHTTYRDLAQAAVVSQDRFTKSEIKFKSTVTIAEVQKIADDLAVEHRELDARIQEANWRTELLE